MFTLNDIQAKYDESGHVSYSLPNGDSLTSAWRAPVSYMDSGLAYLTDNFDSKVNAVNQQALWNREDAIRKEAEEREDTALDRLIKAGERNGVNPIFLLDALSGNTGTAASYSTSAAKTSNYEANSRTSQANSAKIAGAIIAAIAMLGVAILK